VRNTVVNKVWETGADEVNIKNEIEGLAKEYEKALRNNFEHYVPRVWSIELHGLPQISMDVLDVISFLAVDTFTYQHLNQSQRRRVKSIVYQSKRRLSSSRLHREALMATAKEGALRIL
jgi:hypothetical protein